MFFPEALYLLSQRDRQVTWLDPVAQLQQTGAAATSVISVAITVPTERVLILKNAVAFADPGGGLICTGLSLRMLAPPAGSLIGTTIKTDIVAGAADQIKFLNWDGEIMVPPTWRVDCAATFNSAAFSNTVTAHVIGMLIPVGNVQRL